ncbi:MAG: ABC transporter substrate-binding protein [Clostridia bacterium]|nr:ABC transporter substrate-binding protein [Clostridia bacterium]
MKKLIALLLVIAIGISSVACATTEKKEVNPTPAPAPFPVTLKDQTGREVTIETKPEKIVSGYYISSSILISLGLEDKIVGIEAKANKRPIYKLAAPQLIDLPNVGSAKEFNLEGCAALKPDLVILPKKLKSAAESLEQLGLKVLLINPESENELVEAMELIAKATDATEEFIEVGNAMEKAKEDLAKRLSGKESPTVYMAGNSAVLETAGKKMYQSDMIKKAGGTNVADEIEDTSWANVSYEQLLKWNPEYIIIAAEAGYKVEDVLNDKNLAELAAVKNGNVYAMPSDIEAWDSPVPGAFLGSVFLASKLHSAEISQSYFENAVKDFYGTYYGFTK